MGREQIEDLIMNYVAIQCGVRNINPESVRKVYLPGIANHFDRERRECAQIFRVLKNGKQVKMVVAGFERMYEKRNPKAGRARLPFGLDLALESKKVMREQRMFVSDMRHQLMLEQRVFTCETVGIVFMLRKSEHIKAKDTLRLPLLRSEVLFSDRENRLIEYKNIGKTQAWYVTLNVQFSKTDQSGYGRRTKHSRQESFPDTCAVRILENWIAMTRDVYKCNESHGIYEVPGHGTLSIDTLHDVMQKTVLSKGYPVDAKRTTTHSLRYGGATMMAAAGFPQYIIAMYGGWTNESKALRLYTRLPEDILNQVSAHMARMGTGTASQMFIEDTIMITHSINQGRNKDSKKRLRE